MPAPFVRQDKAEQLFEIVSKNPGVKARTLGRLLGLRTPQNIYYTLPGLRHKPYLLYEDDDGGLYPFFSPPAPAPPVQATLFSDES